MGHQDPDPRIWGFLYEIRDLSAKAQKILGSANVEDWSVRMEEAGFLIVHPSWLDKK
jgi:hypothetical protein